MQQEDVPTILQKFAAPAVINQDMLLTLIKDQGPKGEAGKLFVEDGIKLEEIEEIRIEFINILRIDHLWIMPNLVKLKLSNNIIEKIENLDVLVHLKELDLSFNHIRVMEGLNHLIKLEILLLYNNEIDAVTCIDNLRNLVIFSIGNNKIKDWEHVMYLRKFKKLRSLNTCGNPCMEENGYLEYLLAFLSQLIYFQYRMITNDERQLAIDKHIQGISIIEEIEAKEKEEFDAQQELDHRMALHYASYVEYLERDCLFQQMFENDEEGKKLSMINEDTQTAFKEYGRMFSIICQELFELGLKEQSRREKEIELFNTDVKKGKEIIQASGRTIVDQVLERKAGIIASVMLLTKKLIDDLESDISDQDIEQAQRLLEEFNNIVSNARIDLISAEVLLHEQIEDINEIFKINMTDLVESFLEVARGYFSQLRNCEAEYNDNINGLVLYYLSGFGDESKIPSHLINVCGDKDTLSNTLAGSHDMHLQVIDSREDCMLMRLRDWLTKYIKRQADDEIDRNRRRILEISHFMEHQQEEFNSLQLWKHLNLDNIDANILAFEN